jgi:hypothetical protein
MSLAALALNPIVGFPGALTCHVAVWYWAALEATALGLTSNKNILTRAGNIGVMPNGPQRAMLALPRSGVWDFAQIGPAMPPPGTVLLWDQPPTHSAVVTLNGITGYNQACVFSPIMAATYTSGQPAQLLATHKRCFLILADTVVKAAGGVFHL